MISLLGAEFPFVGCKLSGSEMEWTITVFSFDQSACISRSSSILEEIPEIGVSADSFLSLQCVKHIIAKMPVRIFFKSLYFGLKYQ